MRCSDSSLFGWYLTNSNGRTGLDKMSESWEAYGNQKKSCKILLTSQLY
jgi:hypothetical protein